jgi:asparagine synthetase B (glutamine-hydrolysing)
VQTYKSADKEKVNILAHERLAIVGVDSGAQPLMSEDGTIALTVNGEMYDYCVALCMLTLLATTISS